MKNVLTAFALVLLIAPIATAADDWSEVCHQPEARRYPKLGEAMGQQIPLDWIEAHVDKVHEIFAPACERFTSCLTVWGNSIDFCRDTLATEVRQACSDTWDQSDPNQNENWRHCRATSEVFSLAQTRTARMWWPKMQQAAEAAQKGKEILAPRIEIDPPAPLPGQSFDLYVKAYDAESGLPRYGIVVIDGRQEGLTFQKMGYRFQFNRKRDEYGRISFESPRFSVRSAPVAGCTFLGFPEAKATFSSTIPEAILTMEPPPEQWKAGTNTVLVTARDATTGETFDGAVLTPGVILGPSSDPVSFVLKESPDGLCGDPVWLRARLMDHPDTSLPIAPCK